MSGLFFLVSVFFFLNFSQCSSQNRKIDPEIEERINDYILNSYLPSAEVGGLVVAVVQNDDQLLYTNGFGFANQEKEIPNTNETEFMIGSCTKVTFTLLRIMQFVQFRGIPLMLSSCFFAEFHCSGGDQGIIREVPRNG